jgi:thiol-disulfide isomerase/thioredoxin
MKNRKYLSILSIIFTLALLLAACRPEDGPVDEMITPEPEMTEEVPVEPSAEMPMATDEAMGGEPHMATEEPMDGEMTEEPAMPDSGEGAAGDMDEEPIAAPAWYSARLVDVASGEEFSLSDFSGKVIVVETMAIWCSNCLQQQRNVGELKDMLGEREEVVFVVLDIDPNEDAAQLKSYVEQHGFGGFYAVAPAEVSAELGELYGGQVLNPTSAPMLIVDAHGEAHLLPFGVKSAGELQEALQPYLGGDM